MENKLTLEVLAPYLPYGVNFRFNLKDVFEEYPNELRNKILDCGSIYLCISVGKPILRPLSDLTKEIEHNGEMFVPKELLIDRYDLKFDEDDYFFLDYYCIGETDSPWTGYHIIQLLIQWHFDVFGLIEKGLAVDINTIENA